MFARPSIDNRVSRRSHRCLKFVNSNRNFRVYESIATDMQRTWWDTTVQVIQPVYFTQLSSNNKVPIRTNQSCNIFHLHGAKRYQYTSIPLFGRSKKKSNLFVSSLSSTKSSEYSQSDDFLFEQTAMPPFSKEDKATPVAILTIELKRESDRMQTWRMPLLSMDSGEGSPLAQTRFQILEHRDWKSEANFSGFLLSGRQRHRTSRSTDSNTAFRSMKTRSAKHKLIFKDMLLSECLINRPRSRRKSAWFSHTPFAGTK